MKVKDFRAKFAWFSLRQTALFVFAIIMLISNWQADRSPVVYADSTIPKDSIRLRILANSDSIADQAMKRVVRDAVVAQMNTWVQKPDSIEAARRIVTANIPALQALVGKELEEHGYYYSYKVELGIVPFPTKMYGNQVYPAGNYEALRITLGSGQGQNWWCVLFPPLCFMDAVSGEAVAQAPAAPDFADDPDSELAADLDSDSDSMPADSKEPSADQALNHTSNRASNHASNYASNHTSLQITSKAQIHFYLWDKSRELYAWLKHEL